MGASVSPPARSKLLRTCARAPTHTYTHVYTSLSSVLSQSGRDAFDAEYHRYYSSLSERPSRPVPLQETLPGTFERVADIPTRTRPREIWRLRILHPLVRLRVRIRGIHVAGEFFRTRRDALHGANTGAGRERSHANRDDPLITSKLIRALRLMACDVRAASRVRSTLCSRSN